MKKKKVTEKENEWKGVLQEDHTWCNTNFYQVGKSNVTPDSFTTKYTNGSDYDIDKDYFNIGVNKDWDNVEKQKETWKEINKWYKKNWENGVFKKEKRIDFEFTPKTFWQLLPSVAINLHCKEIELTWLCFGMYVKFKRNG